jgi:hypothetical protein
MIIKLSFADDFYVNLAPAMEEQSLYKCKIGVTEGFKHPDNSNDNLNQQPKDFSNLNVTSVIEEKSNVVKQNDCLMSLNQLILTMAIVTFIVTCFMIIFYFSKIKNQEDGQSCKDNKNR